MALNLYPNPETMYAATYDTFGKAYKSVTESFKGRAHNIQGSNIIEGNNFESSFFPIYVSQHSPNAFTIPQD